MQYLTAATAFIFFFASCADKTKHELAVFKAVDQSLQQSALTISYSNAVIYKTLENRLSDEQFSDKAKRLHPKALRVQALSDSMIKYIVFLKTELKNEAPSKSNDEEVFENDRTVTDHVFESHDKGKELFEKLVKYKQDIFSIDTGWKRIFGPTLVLFPSNFNQGVDDSRAFNKKFFSKTPAIATMAMLSIFESNIKNIENALITFCLHNTSSSFCGYSEKPWPIVTQSTNYVKPGEYIEITAGLATFSSSAQPTISFNGKKIDPRYDGVSIYNLKAPAKPGTYSTQVKIEFIKPDGTISSFLRDIQYIVIEEN